MELLKYCDGLMLFKAFNSEDERGSFVKIFQSDELCNKYGIKSKVAEVYYSMSKKNTIRGMHFQAPPFDHDKFVHVLTGSVEDVVVDLRTNSTSYGNCYKFDLCEETPLFLFIPRGFAHGFRSLENNTRMIYLVSGIYNKDFDRGIHYKSINFNWHLKEQPIVSKRDLSFPVFDEFTSPFC